MATRNSHEVEGEIGVVEGDGRGTVVLHLDDDEAFLKVTAERMRRAADDIEVVSTADPEAALERLDAGDVDCVVSDYRMPRMDGLEFLEAVRERYPDLPFLLFTGAGSERIAERAISAGVTDYLRKTTDPDQFTVLANRVQNLVAQRRAERRAREADQRVRSVHERVTDAVVAFDEAWRYTYANEQATELLQRSREVLLGDRVWDVFPDLVGTEIETALREAMGTQETRTVEAYFEPLDTWFEVRVFPDEDGISVYFRDVTERRERERRFDAIFNNTYQFTGLMEPDGTLVEANETALEFGGIDREDVIGERVWDTYWFQLSEETRETAREDVKRAAEGEFVRHDLDVQGADSVVTIDFSIRPLTDERGEVELLIPEGRDITDLKRREEALREERAFTESLLSALPDVLYAFDRSGEFLRWNDRMEAVSGHAGEEIAGMDPLEFIPEDDRERVAGYIQQVFEGEGPVAVESHLLTAGGERVPYEFTGDAIRNEAGDVEGLVGVGRDITERKRHEEKLRRQNERLEEFASVLSHDLRNRLSVARGSLSLAADETDSHNVTRAAGALDRMADLIDDVLELATQGRVVDDPQPVVARDLLDVGVRNTSTEGASVTVDCPPDRRILADSRRAPELVENLVGNAVQHARRDAADAADGHGDDSDGDDSTGPTVRVALEGDTIVVEDDGPGIPGDEREAVFDPGYTTREDGNGFGLAIVKSIAEAHGWTVRVTDSPLGGARFEIRGVESA